MKFKFLLILLAVIFLQGCKSVTNEITKVIENNSPTQITEDNLDGNVAIDDEGNFEETGIEFTNPTSPIEVPKPKDKLDSPIIPDEDPLDGIEFSNPELPSKSQKGPFYMDSDIFIQELEILDREFRLVGNIFIDRVTDNLGSFVLPNNLSSPYIEIRVNGYYFNEVSGEPSDGTISLGSYSSIKDGIAPNINILTTLAQKRIKHLVTEQDMVFEEAEIRARREVLNAFSIRDNLSINLDELRIDRNTQSGAILLAVSVILQANLSTVELSNFIARIREDIRDNGSIDDESILNQICQQTQSLNPLQIRLNLENFYQSLNLENYEIPFFEDYLDSDCNGILNKDDPESFISFKKEKPHFLNNTSNSTIYVYQDKLWILGPNNFTLFYSSDLENWETRYGGSIDSISNPIMLELNEKLFVIGGRTRFICNHDQVCELDYVSVHTIDKNYRVQELVTNNFENYRLGEPIELDGFVDPFPSYPEAYFNESLEDNTSPNFSSANHIIRNIYGSLFVVDKGDYSLNRQSGFVGHLFSNDGVNWTDDIDEVDFPELRSIEQSFDIVECLMEIRDPFDLIEFDGVIYVSNNLYFEVPFGEYHLLKIIERNVYFTEYQNQLFTYDVLRKTIQIKRNRESWETLPISISDSENPINRPFVFKNMIHQILDDDYILIYGEYQFYKYYLGFRTVEEQIDELVGTIKETPEFSNDGIFNKNVPNIPFQGDER